MAKTKISEFSATPANNTDIDGINIAEGCAPSGINDAIRELMSQLKDWQAGTSNDPYVIGSSGSLTLNQGTANGVLYLNGSKVATSGSALTFDGGNALSWSSSVPLYTQTATTGTNYSLSRWVNTGGTFYTGIDNSTGANFGAAYAGVLWHSGNYPLLFGINGSEQMRLTSTGLGIGTSSPAYKLDVRGVLGAGNGTITGGISYSTRTEIGSFSNHSLGLITNGTTQAVLDTSGNLGLGVTPSAWNADYKNFAVGTGGEFYGRVSTTEVGFGSNYYRNSGGSYIYLTSAAASYQAQVGGVHYWFNAPSGTAGNAISFTQAMSLDSNGRLNVGATSFGFAVKAGFRGDSSSVPTVEIQNESATGKMLTFRTNGESEVGSISFTASATTYNTSSDYRLKNITGPITNSGAYIDSLNPVEGTWKADGSTFVGLIAHEVQEASRTQVATGTKDGAEMQSMDYSNSELIANLIAEVKSLRKRLADAGIA